MKFVKLKDLLVETKDGEWGKDEPVNEDDIKVAVIRGADFKNIRVNDFSAVPMKYVPKRKVERKALKEGDILIETAGGTATRPTGRTAIVKRRHLQNGPVLCASFARYMRPNVEMILPDYLYWYLQYLYTIGEMARNQVQHTGVARFQFTQFSNNTYIPVPEFPYQRKVVSILNALDEKIELNNRINKTLEEMAQAIFKSWFVDFEPFRDGEFVESELGMIPKGWEVVKLSEICTTQYGYTASAREEPVGPKFLRVKDINKQNWINWSNVPYVEVDQKNYEKYKLNFGDIVVARMADPGKSAIIDDDSVDAVFASYLVRLSTDSIERAIYIYYFLKSSLYLHYCEGVIGGSVQKNMNAKVITGVNLVLPTKEVLLKFKEIILPLRKQIAANVKESEQLSTLRDTLLPKLMSGEIRVPLD